MNDQISQYDPPEPYDSQTLVPVMADLAKPGLSKPNPPKLTWNVVISWIVVLGIVGFLFLTILFQQLGPGEKPEFAAVDVMNVNLMGRFMVGQVAISPGQKSATLEQIKQFNQGSVEQRWCYAILLNELDSPQAALEQLRQTDQVIEKHNYDLSETQQRVRDILEALFEQYASGDLDAGSLRQPDRQFLEARLGWIGQLALAPPGTPNKEERQAVVNSAIRAIGVVIGIGVAMIGAGGLGLASLVVMLVLLVTGQIRPQLQAPQAFGAIYIETFAIWMVMFVGLQFSVAAIAWAIEDKEWIGWLMPVAFVASLVVLLWPIARGVPRSQVSKDIGWTIGNPIKEIGVAFMAYVALLPALVVAALVAILISGAMSLFHETTEFGSGPTGGHPIQEDIATGDLSAWFLVFITAVVVAPIVEETMFRGVLYRHLRDRSGHHGRRFSVLVAALVNGLIFASIHPQGLIGIPMLTTLAIGFSLVREWRGSLIAPMTMHAINNGLVTGMLFLLMSI